MIKYSNLPRKIKKGLKRAAKKQMSSWKWKQIHIQYVVKCSQSIGYNEPDFKGYQITDYGLY
jgi:hypothetical protein